MPHLYQSGDDAISIVKFLLKMRLHSILLSVQLIQKISKSKSTHFCLFFPFIRFLYIRRWHIHFSIQQKIKKNRKQNANNATWTHNQFDQMGERKILVFLFHFLNGKYCSINYLGRGILNEYQQYVIEVWAMPNTSKITEGVLWTKKKIFFSFFIFCCWHLYIGDISTQQEQQQHTFIHKPTIKGTT